MCVATAVLLKALDVDDKTIMTDYLYTNHVIVQVMSRKILLGTGVIMLIEIIWK